MSFNMDEAEWDAVVNVHLKGHFTTSRFAAAYWRQRSKETSGPADGAIVNTSSESGLYANAGQVNYAAAKAGIASMTIVMARELERIGVRVNAIAPVARTRLTEAVAGDFMNHKAGDFDRFAPENAAAMAIWLASPDAVGINGQVFTVGGGKAQMLQGWTPTTEVIATDVWSLDSLTAARDALTGGRDTGVPPFMPPFEG
jgi:NAD(P)-dependent dehydrogenase (short-subunit alcohol dehydrogenase family)